MKKFLGVVLVALCVLVIHRDVFADSALEFSADMVSSSGAQSFQSKIVSAGGKMRMETPESIVIMRPDKNITWVIIPSQNMYMEQPMDPSKMPATTKEMPGEIERVPLGAETIDGKPTEKFRVTYTRGTEQESMIQWIGQSQIPVKMQAVDGSWTVEYKNMQTGPQPDDLFEVPAGLQKMKMPGMGGVKPSMEDMMGSTETQ